MKLLRLIESGTFRRVGSTETHRADFRLVAATHKPLQRMVADGRFRQDLYYRISAFPIQLPALRDRAEDIPILVDSFIQRGAQGKQRLSVEPEAMSLLQAYEWPGNIRELRNVLERARLFADDGVIRAAHLPDVLRSRAGREERGSTVHQHIDRAVARATLDDEELRRLVAAFPGLATRTCESPGRERADALSTAEADALTEYTDAPKYRRGMSAIRSGIRHSAC